MKLSLLPLSLSILLTGALMAAEKPNIVLIMADDIGYECFPQFGGLDYKVPNIERLGEQGVFFSHCYSQPICTPSRVKIMTGRSNVRNYVDFSILSKSAKTIGHYMKEAGYRSCIAGKWQLFGAEGYGETAGKGMHPKDSGFDHYCLWQVDKKGLRFRKPLLNINGNEEQFGDEVYGPDIFVEHITKFIETESDQPFFVYYPMVLVHNPFLPTPDSKDRQSKDQKKNFQDMVSYMDKCVGKIEASLKRAGVYENTLFIFTADNGTNIGIRSQTELGEVRGGKGKTTNAGTHVPLVLSWPAGIKEKGTVSDQLIDFTDFLPTVLEAAGISPKLDGVSFLPGTTAKPRDHTFCYYNPRPTSKSKKVIKTRFARNQQYKLYGDGRFFDIEADILEKKQLSTGLSEREQTAKKKLEAALDLYPEKGEMILKY